MKIGYFTDLHFRNAVPGTSECPERMSRRIKEILGRCLKNLRKEGVDLIICTGDLVDDPRHPEVEKDLRTLRDMLGGVPIPSIIIPGNHDPAPEAFYLIFTQPRKAMKIEDCEFITFFEDFFQEGELTFRRSDASLVTMHNLLNESPSDVKHTFCLQHYLIYPEHDEEYPYNYENDSVIRELMEASPRKILSISGHYHVGFRITRHNEVSYFCGKAMCEHPFPYYILDTGGDEIIIQEFQCLEAF